MGSKYAYGVKRAADGKAVMFIARQKRGRGQKLPPGTLWFDVLEGHSAQARGEALRALSSRDWSGVEPIVPLSEQEDRLYVYGLEPRGGRYRPFVIRSGKPLPSGVRSVSEHLGTAEEAKALASALQGSGSVVLAEQAPPTPRPELGPGVVAMHVDSEGQHLCIVLEPFDDFYWRTLFFTSNPRWGRRRASEDELALAGYVRTKRTYLAGLLVRAHSELIPTRRSFPSHRVVGLLEEFSAS